MELDKNSWGQPPKDGVDLKVESVFSKDFQISYKMQSHEM